MSALWEEIKCYVKERLPGNSFSLWIHPITPLEEKDNSLLLGCPNKFSMNWVMENYMDIMREKLEQIGKQDYELSLKVAPREKKLTVPEVFQESKQLEIPNMPKKKKYGRRKYNSEFTFDRFVVGGCNEFAYSASRALATGDTWPYDSLFMLSNTGLGKSHLSQAIGNAMLDENPNGRVHYITAEDFVNEMIFAIKNNRTDEFKNRYRKSCDVLLLEEVHFLSGKEKTQLELGHTLDVLANDKKKIIFTSSLLPQNIPNMTKELSSRLTSGIITTLEKPDYRTRVKIIEKKSMDQNLHLSEDIIDLFARKLTRDVRQIESVLRCLKAKSELMNAKINLSLAREVIQSHVSDGAQISIENIQNIICQYFKIDPDMLRSKSRKKIHAYPRNIYVYLCRNYTSATLEDIGRSIKRNHSTIIYSSEVVERKIRVDKTVKNQVNFLKQKIKDVIH